MTIQNDLHKVWASSGTAVDPDIADPAKYATGWQVEIPTFENFNYVLKNSSNNLLALAEQGIFLWQAEITYKAGSRVVETGKIWTCITDHINHSPTSDVTRSYWVFGSLQGNAAPSTLLNSQGFKLDTVNTRSSPTLWEGTDAYLLNGSPIIQFNTANAASKNWGIANVSGELVALDFGTTVNPDGRNIALGQASTKRLYHEGHKPTQSEVSGTIPDAPSDGNYYLRRNGTWAILVTQTAASTLITDVGGYYSVDNVESALQEIGAEFTTVVHDSDVSTAAVINTVAGRDGSGDLIARLFRSSWATEASAVSTAGICFRTNVTTDNYMRFLSKDGLLTFLGSFGYWNFPSGYVKVPGGLIVQWGYYTVLANTQLLKNFPIAFPTGAMVVIANSRDWNGYNVIDNQQIGSYSISSSQYYAFNKSNQQQSVNFLAVGW